MTIAYACKLNVYVCMNFGDEILLRGGEWKTWEKLNFSEKGKNSKFMLQCRLKTYKFSRSQMKKWTSSLDSSRKI